MRNGMILTKTIPGIPNRFMSKARTRSFPAEHIGKLILKGRGGERGAFLGGLGSREKEGNPVWERRPLRD